MKEVVDTLCYSNDTVNCMLNLLATRVQENNKPFFCLTFYEVLTILLSVIGVLVAVIQFKKQMAKNREQNLKTNERNWYLSVIVLPQIGAINEFYRDLINDVISDKDVLQPSSDTYLVQLSEKQAVRKEQINAFFDHIQSLIRSFDFDLSQKIASEVEGLENVVTIILEESFIDNLCINNEVRRRLLFTKKNIISILYKKLLE